MKPEIIIAIITTIAIITIGVFQIKINNKLKELQDVVVINLEPMDGNIKLNNVGNVSLFIYKFEIPNNTQIFLEPRLLAVNSYYWIPAPDLTNLEEDKEYGIKLYLEDEFNRKYISTGGIKNIGNNKFIVWTYKLKKEDWKI